MSILLVGISMRAAAESATRSGYSVVALDAFGDTDLRRTCQTYSLLHDFPPDRSESGSPTVDLYESSKSIDFEEVVYGSGFENHPECVEAWEKEGKAVIGNDSRTLRAVRDWRRLFGFLAEEGIQHPRTRLVEDPSSFREAELAPGSYLIKPVLSGGGHGVRPLEDAERLRCLQRPILIQERLQGTLASLSFVSGPAGCMPLSTNLQLVGNAFSPFRYAGNISPLEAPPRVVRRMHEIAQKISEEYGLMGCNGIDVVISDGEVCVLEVNPRLQGSMEVVERASGVGVFDAHVRSCRGQMLPKWQRRGRGCWGRKIVYASADVEVPSLCDLDFAKDVPLPGTPIRAGAPICTVLGNSDTLSGCLSRLRQLEMRVNSLIPEPA